MQHVDDALAERSVGATSYLLPQDEKETETVVQKLTYRTPKSTRRRPGNALRLAIVNFKEEFMVRRSIVHESIPALPPLLHIL